MSTNTPSLASLKAVAEAATPGPWQNILGLVWTESECPLAECTDLVDATHIATFNPQTAGRLIQALVDARATIEEELACMCKPFISEPFTCLRCNTLADLDAAFDWTGV